MHAQEACAATSKDMHQWLGSTNLNPSNTNWDSFMPMPSATVYKYIYQETLSQPSFHDFHFIYKPAPWMPHNIGFLHENILYGMPVSVLQSWTADLNQHVLSHAIDWVYATFFYSTHAQQIWNLLEEILFSHFMTTLNDASETELAQEDEGYESVSENFNISTPLSRTLSIYHVSTVDDLSFNLANFGWSPTTPEQHAESSPHWYKKCNITCCQLVFTSSDDESPVRSSEHCSQHSSTNARSHNPREADVSSSAHHNLCHHITPTMEQFFIEAWDDDTTSFEEHVPTVPLDDDVWAEEPIPDRCLCIHETPDKPNYQCSYPCPYDSSTFRMDLLQSTPQMKQCITMNRWTSVTSHQIFQISWQWWVTQTFLILQMFQMKYGLHKHSHWLYLKVKKQACIFSTMHHIKI